MTDTWQGLRYASTRVGNEMDPLQLMSQSADCNITGKSNL